MRQLGGPPVYSMTSSSSGLPRTAMGIPRSQSIFQDGSFGSGIVLVSVTLSGFPMPLASANGGAMISSNDIGGSRTSCRGLNVWQYPSNPSQSTASSPGYHGSSVAIDV